MSGNTVFLSAICNGPQFFTANGEIAVGANLYSYLAGSTTNANTYTSNTGLVLNPNPIQINASGYPNNEIWQIQGAVLKFVLNDQYGNPINTWDDVPGINDPTGSQTIAAQAFNQANLAYAEANSALTIAEEAYSAANGATGGFGSANAAANTVAVYANSGVVAVRSNLNLINTSSAVWNVSANGSLADVLLSFTANVSNITANSSLSSNGYCYIPGGFLLQWGTTQGSNGGTGNSTNFPTHFPTACYAVVASPLFANQTYNIGGYNNINFTWEGDANGVRLIFFAIGR